MFPLIRLVELDIKLVQLAASREMGTHTPMHNALEAASSRKNPVFVKRGSSILVMEREQFEEIQQTIGGI
jgi:hypothetical protein